MLYKISSKKQIQRATFFSLRDVVLRNNIDSYLYCLWLFYNICLDGFTVAKKEKYLKKIYHTIQQATLKGSSKLIRRKVIFKKMFETLFWKI